MKERARQQEGVRDGGAREKEGEGERERESRGEG